MREILIGRYKNNKHLGKVIWVDDEDYPWLSQFTFHISDGYPTTTFTLRDGERWRLRLHNLLLHYLPGKEVDHINRNKLDNRRCNLRYVDHSENVKNVSRKDCKSGIRGVCWTGQLKSRPWYATAHYKGRQFNLGRYATKEEAAAAYVNFQDKIANHPETIKMPKKICKLSA